MEIVQTSESPGSVRADALVVGAFAGEPLAGAAAEVDALLGGAISELAGLAADAEVTGKRGEVTVIHSRREISATRVVVAGLGERGSADGQCVREAAGAAIRRAACLGAGSIALALHRDAGMDVEAAIAAEVEGALLGGWLPGAYQTRVAGNRAVERCVVLAAGGEAARGIERGRVFGESVNLARTLANEPPNELTPAVLARRAQSMAAECGIECESLGEEQMLELGMRAILAVSAGSEEPARLVTLRHGAAGSAPDLALIGKGITFDTGGISLKPRDGMETMKGDMAGAAAVIAAMRAIALLRLPINVVGIAVCAENMPGGRAYRPGDVVRCMNGKTVEVVNTDAEGRMVLADGLAYAVRNLRASRVVDVATLTGASVVALGRVCSAAVTNNRPLLESTLAAARSAGERVWEMPLFPEYREQIRSDIADMKNSGGRDAGALTAAAFLREFVDDTPWVHLDIAGKGALDKPKPHAARGATGVMTRTLVYLAESLSRGGPGSAASGKDNSS